MREELLLTGILVLVIIISGCIQQAPKSIKEANVCGDGICGATEDCNNCVEDCGCEPSKYCSDIGICRTGVCGDEICSPEENRTQNCCEDCGCQDNKICNKATQTCQEKPTISDEDVEKIAEDYMNRNNITGTITDIIETYYKNETLKQVSIDCSTKDIPYPCAVVLYIDNEGKIVEDMRTS